MATMLTGPIQQLLPSSRQTPCPAILCFWTLFQIWVFLWPAFPTYEPVLGCRWVEQSQWTWSLAQGSPLQSRDFRPFPASKKISSVFWYLDEISFTLLDYLSFLKKKKNGIRDACSTAEILDMPQMITQMMSHVMAQMMPQTCPKHTPKDAPDLP